MTAVAEFTSMSVDVAATSTMPTNSLLGVGAVIIGFTVRQRRHLASWKEHEDQKAKRTDSVPGVKIGQSNRTDLSLLLDELRDAGFIPRKFTVTAREDGTYRQSFVFVSRSVYAAEPEKTVMSSRDFGYLREITRTFHWKTRLFRNEGSNGGDISIDCDYAVIAGERPSIADLQVNDNLVEFATGPVMGEDEQ